MPEVHISLQKFQPFIPILKEYFGFPFVQIELAVKASEFNEVLGGEASELDEFLGDLFPDAKHNIGFEEYVSHEVINGLVKKHFDGVIMSAELLETLYIAANLYYYRNVPNYEYAQELDIYGQKELSIMREEIAKLYSFLHQHYEKGKNGSSRPISINVDKEQLVIPNTLGWLDALLENHLFPNCLPDVKSDEDAKAMWDRKKKSGRPSRVEINAITHGVAKLFHDRKIVEDTAPAKLCEFILDLLKEMGHIHDATDKQVITPGWIKSEIHRTKKEWDQPGFHNTPIRIATLEELNTVTPDQQAYLWLFNPKTESSGNNG